MKININLSIPFKITRSALYIIAILTSITVILLPWSVIAYLKFYQILIPVPAIQINLTPDYTLSRTFILIDDTFSKFLEDDSEYDFRLNFKGYCIDEQTDLLPVMFQASMRNKESIYGSLSSFYAQIDSSDFFWPISSFSDNAALTRSSFLLYCSPKINHYKSSSFIPYSFRDLLPALLQNYESSNDLSLELGSFQKKKFAVDHGISSEKSILIEFSKPIAIDKNSNLEISIKWEGIRYYIYYYRITCFAIGVLSFWTISSTVCIAVSILVWSYFVSSFYGDTNSVPDQDETVGEVTETEEETY